MKKLFILSRREVFLSKACALVISCSVFSAFASEPLLPFQGYLQKANGDAVEDGAKLVQFKLYDAPIGGNTTWAGEVHKLSVNGGLVNTILGTRVSLSKVKFNNPQYLEITVDADESQTITPADPPLLPRQVIIPAVFASRASAIVDDSGEAHDWSVIFQSNNPANSTIRPDKIGDKSISLNKIAKPGNSAEASTFWNDFLFNGNIHGDKIAPASLNANHLDPNTIISLKNIPSIPSEKLPALAFDKTVFDMAVIQGVSQAHRFPGQVAWEVSAGRWNTMKMSRILGAVEGGASSDFCRIDTNSNTFSLDKGIYFASARSANMYGAMSVSRIRKIEETIPEIAAMPTYGGSSGVTMESRGILVVEKFDQKFIFETYYTARPNAGDAAVNPGGQIPNDEFPELIICDILLIKLK